MIKDLKLEDLDDIEVDNLSTDMLFKEEEEHITTYLKGCYARYIIKSLKNKSPYRILICRDGTMFDFGDMGSSFFDTLGNVFKNDDEIIKPFIGKNYIILFRFGLHSYANDYLPIDFNAITDKQFECLNEIIEENYKIYLKRTDGESFGISSERLNDCECDIKKYVREIIPKNKFLNEDLDDDEVIATNKDEILDSILSPGSYKHKPPTGKTYVIMDTYGKAYFYNSLNVVYNKIETIRELNAYQINKYEDYNVSFFAIHNVVNEGVELNKKYVDRVLGNKLDEDLDTGDVDNVTVSDDLVLDLMEMEINKLKSGFIEGDCVMSPDGKIHNVYDLSPLINIVSTIGKNMGYTYDDMLEVYKSNYIFINGGNLQNNKLYLMLFTELHITPSQVEAVRELMNTFEVYAATTNSKKLSQRIWAAEDIYSIHNKSNN